MLEESLFYQTKGAINVEKLERILSMLDHSLGNKKKRHIAGGILMSVSLLFGGVAFTVITLKSDEKEKENENEYEQKYLE